MARSSQANQLDWVLSRRRLLQAAGFGAASFPWLAQLAAAMQQSERRRRLVVLWMGGGPSQIDTFDPKPGHPNGGSVKAISTSVPGIQISENLPGIAQRMNHLAVVRSLSTQEGDHARGTYLVRTGRRPGTNNRHPAIGSVLAKELHQPEDALPSYVSVGVNPQLLPEAFSPGYLGPEFAATMVSGRRPEGDDGFANLEVSQLHPSRQVSPNRMQRRRQLWESLQDDFLAHHPHALVHAHDVMHRRAFRMMNSKEVEAFDLSGEADSAREAYGRGVFGQGCLLARRLLERGVSVVEVALGFDGGLGWDTHQNNFETTSRLCAELDQGWSRLLDDLAVRGLLEETTMLWIGEFGRTPEINQMAGRDHFPDAWSCVLAGGGIRGGQVYGATTPDGKEVAEDKVAIEDILATVCRAVGVDPHLENISELGRPFKLAEGQPIKELLDGVVA